MYELSLSPLTRQDVDAQNVACDARESPHRLRLGRSRPRAAPRNSKGGARSLAQSARELGSTRHLIRVIRFIRVIGLTVTHSRPTRYA